MADLKVTRGAELESDYYLVLMKVSLKLRKEGRRQARLLLTKPTDASFLPRTPLQAPQQWYGQDVETTQTP